MLFAAGGHFSVTPLLPPAPPCSPPGPLGLETPKIGPKPREKMPIWRGPKSTLSAHFGPKTPFKTGPRGAPKSTF